MVESQVVPGSIVVGLDSSPTAHRALLWAAEQAHFEGVPLTVVHAVGRDIGVWVDVEALDMRDVLDASIRASDTLLKTACDEVARLRPDLDVHMVTAMSGVHETLLGLAGDANMVVLGPHAPTSHATPALDTVQFLVDAGTPCAVGLPSRVHEFAGRGTMVLGDGSPASEPTIEWAFRHAQQRGRRLTVVHCLADLPSTGLMVDLALMDEIARMEAGLGASMLGFGRILLYQMVHRFRARYPDVVTDLAVNDVDTDDLLARAAEMDVVIFDRRYTRRAAEQVLIEVTSGHLEGVVIILPVSEALIPRENTLASPEEELADLGELSESEPMHADPDEGRPEIHPAPELVPVRVRRRRTQERGPWRYLKRYIDDPDIK